MKAVGEPREPAAAPQRRASTLRSSSLSFSSDEFIQAQQQLARWASEEAVPARDYFPSPTSPRSPAGSSGSGSERPAAFPEYTHWRAPDAPTECKYRMHS